MHNMGKTVGELHSMLIEYKKGLPKKAETPQVMMIKGGKIQKANKKLLKVKGKGKANGKGKYKQVYILKPKNPKPSAKEHPAKDDACHYCKEVGHWKRNCLVYLVELLKKIKQVGSASSSAYNSAFILLALCSRVCKHRISIWFLTNKVDKTPYELWYGKVPNLSYLKVWGCEALVKRDTPDKLEQRSVKCDLQDLPKWKRWGPKDRIELQTLILNIEIEAMNAEIQFSMMDNYGRGPGRNLPPGCKTVKDQGRNGYIPHLKFVRNTFILGIKIYRDRSKRLIGLCQNAYMDKILKRYKMDNSKRGHIPMQERLDLNKSQGAQTPKEVNRMKNVPYASAVGSIMYAVRCTRPDVAFAQNLTSRFQQNPGELHWTAVKNILKYLRNTKDMFLVYGGNPSTELRVECYCDAGFETDRDDTKSQTGYVFVLNGGAVDWKSSKQSTIAMSATESEYIAASEAAMEAVWIRKFISGLGIVPTINEPLNMYCDNSAAIHYANEPGVQKGARHYHRRYHYVRECVELGEIRILKVHTDNNLADPFTKALSNRKLTQHARSMGLRPASSFM
ncbi:retrotransposon protein, putative, ty1-copia subclass [Tanacetum coccineum]